VSKRLHIFQHVPFENAEHIAVWAQRQGFTISVTRWFDGEKPPLAAEIDWLVILGGPMNIYEHRNHPWLIEEKKFISEVIGLKKKIVGICLGAQLLADVLGAKVYQNQQKEIGWFPVQWSPLAVQKIPTLPKENTVLHWHGDTFDLPANSQLIVSSAACVNQGFIHDNHILAFQFHIESTAASLQVMCEYERDELVTDRYIQTEAQLLGEKSHFNTNHQLLDSWLAWLQDS
jgi:GMP synthase-like glutamine amidotransferase